MRMTVTRIVLAIVLYTGASGAASAQGLRLNFPDNKATYREIFAEIEKQGNVAFAYRTQDFHGTAPVDVPQGDLSLGRILDIIFEGTDYRYELHGKHIFITKEKRPDIEVPQTHIRSSVNPGTSRRRGGARELIREAVDSTFIEVRYPAGPTVVNFDNIGGTSRAVNYPFSNLAVKINVPYLLVTQTPSLAVELGTGRRTTLELSVVYNPFAGDKKGTERKKSTHTIIRPELRLWLCERHNGHFFGAHAFYAEYNDMASHNFPLLFKRGYRYDGHAVGVGLTYGFHQPVSRRWGIEFDLGLGVAHVDHKRFDGVDAVRKKRMYAGPTRAGVTLVYQIK